MLGTALNTLCVLSHSLLTMSGEVLPRLSHFTDEGTMVG